MAAENFLPRAAALAGSVLYLETLETKPPHWVIEYFLLGFGKRGWLNHFQAILVGRPKAWTFARLLSLAQKAAYCQQQRETVVQTVRTYNAHVPIVQNVDFGHTDPQLLLPSGQMAHVLGSKQRIFLRY